MVGKGKTYETLTEALEAVFEAIKKNGAPVVTQYVCAPNGGRCLPNFFIENTNSTTVIGHSRYNHRFSVFEMRREFQKHHKEHDQRLPATIFVNYIYQTCNTYLLPDGETTQYVAIQHHPRNHPHFGDAEAPPNTQGHFHVRPALRRSDGSFSILDTSIPTFDDAPHTPQEHYWYRVNNGGRDFWYAEEESGTCSSQRDNKDDRDKDGGAGGEVLHAEEGSGASSSQQRRRRPQRGQSNSQNKDGGAGGAAAATTGVGPLAQSGFF